MERGMGWLLSGDRLRLKGEREREECMREDLGTSSSRV